MPPLPRRFLPYVLALAGAAWACGDARPRAEGEACVASSECELGLVCDFRVDPPVCAPTQTTYPDAGPDPDEPAPDASLPDAGSGAADAAEPPPDAAEPPPDAAEPPPDAEPLPDAEPPPDASA